tara:strand:+ start:183 stop:830 length:648 start_codon:yes stop_codon:yes gene_type:complete
MSDLDNLKTQPEAKRLLKGVHFDFTGAEITYTNGTGACSGHNDMVLAKSVDDSTPLTEEQQSILDQIGTEFTPLKKEVGNTRETNQNPEGNELDMSVELQKQLDDQAKLIATMARDNGIMKAQADLGLFELDAEIEKELAEAMVDGGNGEAVLKALTAVKAAIPEAKVEVENPVAKALLVEKGIAGDAEEDIKVEKSILEQLQDNMTAQAEKGAK